TDAIFELSWAFALAVKEQRELNATPSEICDVLRFINYIRDDGIGRKTFPYWLDEFSDWDIRIIERYLSESAEDGEKFIAEPWPSADQLRSSGLEWTFYSEQRLLERTRAVYAGALRIYKEMVDQWFRSFGPRLQLYQLLPVNLEGQLIMPDQRDTVRRLTEPTLDWRPRCLPVDAKSTVDFELGPREEFRNGFAYYCSEERIEQQRLRPDARTEPCLFEAHSGLKIFGSRPAYELAHDWLQSELGDLDWAEL
ncbi:MAG: hypothetical protein OXU67_12340, partial [Chloroflexota bacterium]|nr:hypothetical protein [Chloroflexota bacterium]